MGAFDQDIYEVLARVVAKETIWLKHYIGEVVDNLDSDNLGKVKVTVDMLGFNTSDLGFWAFPRDKHSMSIPKIGETVEIYFINGNRNYPVYMGIANEIKDAIPKAFDGKATTHVLFQDPDAEDSKIVYDSTTKTIKIFDIYFKIDFTNKIVSLNDDAIKIDGIQNKVSVYNMNLTIDQ